MTRSVRSLSLSLISAAVVSLTLACAHHGAGAPRVPLPLGNLAAPAATPVLLATPAGPDALAVNASSPSSVSRKAGDSDNRARELDRAVSRTLAGINELLDAFFDYNAFQLRPDAIQSITTAAEVLREHMQSDAAIRLVVEGHCDERGSSEFNLALGDRRAESVRDLLTQLGLPAQRMTTISYGENKPACGEANENCWQRNRRAHIRHERE